MIANQSHVRIAGMLFLLAMVASLTGGFLLESILNAPDYLSAVHFRANLLRTGVVLEMINALSVIGIAVILYPVLRTFSERMALGYFAFRLIESIACVFAAVIPLLIMNLVKGHTQAGMPQGSNLQNLGVTLLATRNMIASLLIPLFYSLGALLFYFLLFQTSLIPRFISIWGLIGVLGILIIAFTGIKGSLVMVFALPIIMNELFLGVWLIVKGFNPTKIYNQNHENN